tara:strand:- start:330 stop:599 length:270 start_codon:yes stop_codon:yes gene_type:complete
MKINKLESKTANLSNDAQEKLKMLNGCEVRSVWNYEGIVSIINKNEVWKNGEKIDVLNTNKKINSLFDEYFQDEFGCSPKEYYANFGNL